MSNSVSSMSNSLIRLLELIDLIIVIFNGLIILSERDKLEVEIESKHEIFIITCYCYLCDTIETPLN